MIHCRYEVNPYLFLFPAGLVDLLVSERPHCCPNMVLKLLMKKKMKKQTMIQMKTVNTLKTFMIQMIFKFVVIKSTIVLYQHGT